MEPFTLVPWYRPQPWGGARLARLPGRPVIDESLADRPLGESWEVSNHPLHLSEIAAGPLTGTTLRKSCRQHPEILGPQFHGRLPILLKLLHVREYLSVQVHPSDDHARRLTPEVGGKAEAWVVLDAAPGATLYAGFHLGVTRDDIARRWASEAILPLLRTFRLAKGDAVFLPAGTVHAVGGDILLAEVQQPSDTTFRLYDWGRVSDQGLPRPLHPEAALECLDLESRPDVHCPSVVPATSPGTRIEPLVDCPEFRVERWTIHGAAALEPRSEFEIWLTTSGSGQGVNLTTGFCLPGNFGGTIFLPRSSSPWSWIASGGSEPWQLLRIRAGRTAPA